MIKVDKQDFNDYKEELMGLGIPFTLYVNNMSSKIEGGFCPPHYTGDTLHLKHVAFIATVKRHVRKKIDTGKLVVGEPIKKANYFDPGTKRSGFVRNAYEVDIDSAYWDTAYMQKIISRNIHRYGLTVPKKVRLMALGSLGKKTAVFHFDGKKMNTMESVFDKDTCYFWDKVCAHVGDVMTTIASNISDHEYFFYWTDALFLRKSAVPDAKRMIRRAGYDFKVKKIDKITFSQKQILFHEPDRDPDKQRSFMLPSNKSRQNKDIII
jgi:hypothetical protein